MYEETKSIDWKGIFLKVVIAFLVVLIAVKGISLLKGDKEETDTKNDDTTIVDKNATATFTSNLEKLRNAGKSYFEANGSKLPKEEGSQAMITLNELISLGNIASLSDEEGKSCDGESSYVTAILENGEYKVKANLVCGDASSYSLVYLDSYDNNDDNDNTVVTTNNNNNGSYTNTNVSSTKTNGNSTSCTTCGTKVNVETNTTVNQNVSVNGKTPSTNNNTTTQKPSNNNNNNSSNSNPYLDEIKYYTVRFDSNGGNTVYRDQTVKEYNTAYNPGEPYKSGYKFMGWYLNNVKYNFNTVVTKNITLVAKYQKVSNNNDDDDYYDNYDDSQSYTDDLVEKTYTSYVYTMGTFNHGVNAIRIDHTLKIPSALNKSTVKNVRIKNITFSSVIDSRNEMKTYEQEHSNTYIYNGNTGDTFDDDPYDITTLSKVDSNYVWFDFSQSYKSLNSARNNGFNVSWGTTRMASHCSNPFGGVCNVGIVYKVTWQYQIYE